MCDVINIMPSAFTFHYLFMVPNLDLVDLGAQVNFLILQNQTNDHLANKRAGTPVVKLLDCSSQTSIPGENLMACSTMAVIYRLWIKKKNEVYKTIRYNVFCEEKRD